MPSSSKKNGDVPWWQGGFALFAKLSGWIAGPVVIALFIGKWLDRKYGTEPWLFLAVVSLAFIISSIGIAKEAGEEMKKMSPDNKKDKHGDEDDK